MVGKGLPLQHPGSIRHWQRLDIVTASPPPQLVVFGSRCTLGCSRSSSHRHRHTSVALLRCSYLQWAALGCHVEDDYESGGACLVARCIPPAYMPHAGKAETPSVEDLCLRFTKSGIPIRLLVSATGNSDVTVEVSVIVVDTAGGVDWKGSV